jgi:taurine dioxygenase
LFANLYLAYEQLSAGLQSFLRPLSAVHSATRSYGPKSTLQNDLENMRIGKDNAEPPEQIHPVIRVHEITQRASLWINPTYTLRFEGMTQAESEPLLKYLNEWAVQPTFMTRVQWQPGTLVMWDNRCTQHCATSDYHGHRRSMLRTTVQGSVPQKTSPSSIS